MKYVNFKFHHGRLSFNNPLSLLMHSKKGLNEGIISSYPINVLKRYLMDYFGFDEEQISIINTDNGVELGKIFIPNIDENLNIVERALGLCGYFISTKETFVHEGNEWLDLQFEPLRQTNIREKVESKYQYLLHITPKYNKDKILNNGFSPRTKNSLFNYPHRIYFMFDLFPNTNLDLNMGAIHIGKQLARNNHSEGNDNEYTVFRVAINNIPKNVEFYADPNFDMGIYINVNLKSNVIIDICDLKF